MSDVANLAADTSLEVQRPALRGRALRSRPGTFVAQSLHCNREAKTTAIAGHTKGRNLRADQVDHRASRQKRSSNRR